MPETPRSYSLRAFTLIELLTVIAIVGVLAAILTPVVGKARSSARDAQCKSNLRQIGAAMALFAHDNDGRLPAVGETESSADSSKLYWQLRLNPYTGVTANVTEVKQINSIFTCPEWENIRAAGGISLSDFLSGYAMTTFYTNGVADTTRRLSLAEVRDPSVTLLLIERHEQSFDPTESAGGPYLAAPDARGAHRHGSTANYLFVDGHVSSKSPEAAKGCFPK